MCDVPFDLNGWDYGQERSWLADDKGGKAVGLALCERLAEGSTFFRVPPWFAMNRENADTADETNLYIRDIWLARHKPWSVIIRSSGRNEDWHDGRSGLGESVVTLTYDFFIKLILRERVAKNRLPVVVQSMADGYGCVVDVGWSWILGKPVVRFAIGNTTTIGGRERFTSATWDNEARFGLYDAETGEPIIPLEDVNLSPVIPQLVRELVASLRRAEIDYGVQLEAVVHPDFPECWHLVQLRPTPDAMRGTMGTLPRDGRLMMASCRVSKPGICEGEAIVLSDRGNDLSVQDLAYEIAHMEGTERERRFDDEEERTMLSGKIILWDDQRFPKSEWTVYRTLGIARLGAVGQIAVRTIVNSSHGTFLRLADVDPNLVRKATDAKTASLIFGTPKSYGCLRFIWPRDAWPQPNAPIRLRIVSDGIYGEVYRIS